MQQQLFPTDQNLLPKQGSAILYPDLFSEQSTWYFQQLVSTIAWKQEPIKMFGKSVLQPRLTAWYGDADKPYSYSGITMQPLPWTDILLEIKTGIEAIAQVKFTSALLNLYRDGQDSMGWHRDNEKELGANPVIGSVSLGATRTFQLRHYTDKKPIVSIPLTSGSFLLMKDETQHYWEHRIPKITKVISPRINITFRVLA